MDVVVIFSVAEANGSNGCERDRFYLQRPGIIPWSTVGNGCDFRSDGPFAQRLSSLYVPFDCCSLLAAGTRVERG
jgi:hypothetical protein